MPSQNLPVGAREDWERLSHLLLLGFGKITQDLTLENEFKHLFSIVSLPPNRSELHHVFTFVAPNVAERVEAYRSNISRIRSAKDALEDCIDKVESCEFVTQLLHSSRKVLLTAIKQHHILTQKKRNMNVRIATLEWSIAHAESPSQFDDRTRFITKRQWLLNKMATINRELLASTQLIGTLEAKVEGYQTQYNELDSLRNSSFATASSLNSSVQENEEENWAIDFQTKNLAHLIISEFQFDVLP